MATLDRKLVQPSPPTVRGAQPADLPVEQATKFDFVVSLKTARALGVRVPSSVLIAASRVID